MKQFTNSNFLLTKLHRIPLFFSGSSPSQSSSQTLLFVSFLCVVPTPESLLVNPLTCKFPEDWICYGYNCIYFINNSDSFLDSFVSRLTFNHFMPLVSFCIPWKHQIFFKIKILTRNSSHIKIISDCLL